MARFVWALTAELPLSAVEQATMLLPEKAVGESAFNKDFNDRIKDPIWVVQGLYKDKPDTTGFEVSCAVLASSLGHAAYAITCEQVPVDGWLTKNQQSFAPMEIGRFIIHGSRDRKAIPAYRPGIEMDVSCAFGTGEHPTTHGCLMMLHKLPRIHKARVLDLGTGSGVLAIALTKLWGDAKVVASDLDAPSVAVARRNAGINRRAASIRTVTANGFRSRAIGAGAPYDLILSNIFARPLAKLAPAMARHLKPGGRVILAGFLHPQVNLVRNAYAKQGVFLNKSLRFGHWTILMLKKS